MKEKNVKCFAYPDKYIEHGTPKELENKYGMDEESICNYIKFKVNEYRKIEKEEKVNNNINNELIS